MYFFDTETCGLHGFVVLIQYSEGLDDDIHLWNVWDVPVEDTIGLIEDMVEEGVVAFNLAFDWFHICKLYTIFSLLSNQAEPPDLEEVRAKELEGRDGLCLKPKHAIDLMLVARKGKYQSMMKRKPINIRRVPTAIAFQLADELNKRIKIPPIYFAKLKNKHRNPWQVQDVFDDLGEPVPELKNIVLHFAPSSALKALAVDMGIADEKDALLYEDVSLPAKAYPQELGYAPFASAVNDWAWPDVISIHQSHWYYNTIARRYARDDVYYTKEVYKKLGYPEPDDVDSTLAAMVGAVRWKGFTFDKEKLLELRANAAAKESRIREILNYNSPPACKKYLMQVLDETEMFALKDPEKGTISTKGLILEELAKWKKDGEVCDHCYGEGCPHCEDGIIPSEEPHPAAIRAQQILEGRRMKKEIELYDKLLKAGRFHASFQVIGTLSSRMSGTDGLNPQGIKRADEVRDCFTLAPKGMVLSGGDFSGFEVCLADAVYSDPDLHQDLLSGKKIHGLFGVFFFPPMSYEEIVATAGLPGDQDKYTRSKNGVFALLYGGEAHTLQNRVGISEENAIEAYGNFCKKYPTFGKKRQMYFDMFCSMTQPGGIGSKVEWKDPSEYIESMLGFRRYFTLENKICKVLYDLANDPPKDWTKMTFKVVRRQDRGEQTAIGAVRSALYAAAFTQQAANMRAAGNHVIQSSGADITKITQAAAWEVQPAGIHLWRVMPMNVHDEIMAPALPQFVDTVEEKVMSTVESFRPKVPLIKMEWKKGISSWAGKKS